MFSEKLYIVENGFPGNGTFREMVFREMVQSAKWFSGKWYSPGNGIPGNGIPGNGIPGNSTPGKVVQPRWKGKKFLINWGVRENVTAALERGAH